MSSIQQPGPTDEPHAHDRPFADVRAAFSAWELIEPGHRDDAARREGAALRRGELTDTERATLQAVQAAYLRGLTDGTAAALGATPDEAARLHHQRAFMASIEDRAAIILHLLAIKNSPRRQIVGITRELLAVAQAIRSLPVALWPAGWHETREEAEVRRCAYGGALRDRPA